MASARALRVSESPFSKIRDALDDHISIRIDANQEWDRATARKTARQLDECGLDFIEQPVPSWDIDCMPAVARSAC